MKSLILKYILFNQYSRKRTHGTSEAVARKRINVGFHSDINTPVSFKLGVMTGTTKQHSLLSV